MGQVYGGETTDPMTSPCGGVLLTDAVFLPSYFKPSHLQLCSGLRIIFSKHIST
jgi:hypothetical protein